MTRRPRGWPALLTLGSDLLWKFSVSGLPTLLLLVIFLGLVWCLVTFEQLGGAENPSLRRLFMLARGRRPAGGRWAC